MAQQDAMEQVKEVVRLLIKYRFWIATGAAALFGLIAYFIGSGPIQAAAKKETDNIIKAEKEVKGYTDPSIPTKEYEPLVQEKTEILTKDVNSAWKTLYDRQAPLLTWPETVQERFQQWGRKWPENVDAGKVTLAQIDYINAYKDYVDMVYKTFNPFDYETGEGIVAAPPKEVLLRPAVFSDEKVPGLSKIWSAQERLWIQRTLLEVVAQVNKNANAKDWNTATIRQVVAIEVGNPDSQDQHSLAKNETLEEAEVILAPGETAEAPAAAAGGPGGGSSMPGMGRMGGMMGMGSAGSKQESENVYYLKAGNASQYRILPVEMTVLIDQDHVQDLLVELENSPMSIQVKDFELRRPMTRVVKPEKGNAPAGFGGGMMGMGMMRGMMGSGMGGGYSDMQQMMMKGQSGMMGRGMGMPGMGMMGRGMMPGMGGGAGANERKGTDNRSTDRKGERAKLEEKIKNAKGPSLFDPYFDIVEVTVYGQARFFKPPPAEPTAEPSPGQTPPVGVAAAASPPASPPAETKGAAAPAPAAAGKEAAAAPAEKSATPAGGAPAGKAATPPAGAPAEKPAVPAAGAPPKAAAGADAAGKPAAPAPAGPGPAAKTGDSAAKPPAGQGGAAKPSAGPAAPSSANPAVPPAAGDAAKPKS